MSVWKRNGGNPSILKDRILYFRLLVALPFALAAVRLVQLQVYQHRALLIRGDNQSVRRIVIPALRGDIVDRKGRPLVQNAPLFQLWANRDLITKGSQKDLFAQIIGIEPEDIRTLFSKNSQRSIGRQTLLFDNLPYGEAVQILARQEELPSLNLQTTFQRRYPDPWSLSHILGYIGEASEKDRNAQGIPYSVGDRVGKNGVENRFNKRLFGVNGSEIRRVDAHGYVVGVEAHHKPQDGATLRLSIDRDLQHKAAGLMEGKQGALIAIDPYTGEILASVSSPAMTLDDFRYRVDTEAWNGLMTDPGRPLLNRVFQGQYPPGSTYKPVVAIAALNEGVLKPDETINCNGTYRVGRRRFRCWKRHGHGKVNLHKALRESCDTFFYEMGMRLGVDKIARYARMFGLGAKTGVELANEKDGLVPTEAYKEQRFNEPWQAGETPSIAIGQGFDLVTPAQLAALYGMIANGGIRTGLTLLPRESAPITTPTPAIAAYLAPIQKGLEAVVNEPHGTGGWSRLRHHRVAGKTGTAQVIGQQEPVDDMEDLEFIHRDHAWFVAYAPVTHPRIVVAVIAEHAGHGGSAAAPIVRQVIQYYLDEVLELPPTVAWKPKPKPKIVAPKPVSATTSPVTDPSNPVNSSPQNTTESSQ